MAFPASESDFNLAQNEEDVENQLHVRMNSIRGRGRLSVVAPTEYEADKQTLIFKHVTKAQEKTRKRQQPVKLEPLPVLKTYQDHKKPEYIYEMNRFKLMASRVIKPPGSTEERKSIKSLVQFHEDQESTKKVKKTRRSFDEVFSPSSSKPSHTSIGRRGLFATSSSAYPAYSFHDREEVIKANICNPLQIIKIVRENEHLGFLYMISAVPKSSIEYDTYNLKVVSYENINKSDYYTISKNAVTHICNDDVEFIETERWEQEYLYHRELTKIPIFSLFRKWKAFNVWKKNVRSKKISGCRKSLQKNLFIVNQTTKIDYNYVKEKLQVAPTIQEIKSGTVAPGRSGLIRCEGAGVPPPAFEWYKGEKKLFNGQQGIIIQNFSTRSILTVTNVTQEHFGNYTCVAANKLGTTNASLPLNQIIEPTTSSPVTSPAPSTAQYGITGSADVLFSCWYLVLTLSSFTSIFYLKNAILQ